MWKNGHILLAFYKSTLWFYLIFAVLFLLFMPDQIIVGFGILSVFFVFLYREIFLAHEYVFYFNKHIDKWQLYGFSLVLNLFLSMCIKLLYNVI